MFSIMLEYFKNWIDLPYIFSYISFRSASAALTSFCITMLIGPKMIQKLKHLKLGQLIRHDGPQTHLKKSGTPTMGGLLILFALFSTSLIWQDLQSSYTWIPLLAAFGYGLLGFLDDSLKIKNRDSKGISAKTKLFWQMFLGSLIGTVIYCFDNSYTTSLYIPFLKNPILDLDPFHGIFYIAFAALLLTGTANAVNLTDGLDGLATGLVSIALLPLTIISYLVSRSDFADYLLLPFLPHSSELTILTMTLLGASLGFLWFNSHPAQIMMGDTGSLSYGALLGTIAILLKRELLLLIIGGVFVLETLSVIIQVAYFKKTKGRRFFKMAPLHHHFEMIGWEENQVVNRFWITGILFALTGLLSLKLQ